MNKITFFTYLAAVCFCQNITAIEKHDSSNQYYPTNGRDLIVLRDGHKLQGILSELPSLHYPTGIISLPTEKMHKVAFIKTGHLWRIQAITDDGAYYFADLEPKETVKWGSVAPAVGKKHPDSQKEVGYSFIDYIAFHKPINQEKKLSSLHVIEFTNGTLLPVTLAKDQIQLSDGRHDYSIAAQDLIDVSHVTSLQGIAIEKNGDYGLIPPSQIKDDSIAAKVVSTEEKLDIPWRYISRIYLHNEDPNSMNNQTADNDEPSSAPTSSNNDDNIDIDVEDVPDVHTYEDNDTQEPAASKQKEEKIDGEAIVLRKIGIGTDGKPIYEIVSGISVQKPSKVARKPVKRSNEISLADSEYSDSLVSPDDPLKKDNNENEDEEKEEQKYSSKRKDADYYTKDGAVRTALLASRLAKKRTSADDIAYAEIPQHKETAQQRDPYIDSHGYYTASPQPIYHQDHLRLQDPDEQAKDADLVGMVFIKPEKVNDEYQSGSITLPSYYIDKYPISNKQYNRFVKATGYARPKQWGTSGKLPKSIEHQPVVNISYYDALAYAQWAGKRIPTDAELCRAYEDKQISINSRRPLREWTSTQFAPIIEDEADIAWFKQIGEKLGNSDYRALRGTDTNEALPMPSTDGALNVTFRTIIDPPTK